MDHCRFCKSGGNKLQHIHGFGAMNPRLMLILINPTYRNLSSDPRYRGPRFPFIGVRQLWRVLADGGFLSKSIAYSLPPRNGWQMEDTKKIQNELLRNKIFLTNVVKCCYSDSRYPKPEVIKDQVKILAEEIRMVKPKNIVAFGSLVYKILTERNIKLSSYRANAQGRRVYFENISGLSVPVIPSYFPVGRGNPRKAIMILKRVKTQRR